MEEWEDIDWEDWEDHEDKEDSLADVDEEDVAEVVLDIFSHLVAGDMERIQEIIKDGAQLLANEAGVDLEEILQMPYYDLMPQIENFVVNEGLEYLTIGDILNEAGNELDVDAGDLEDAVDAIGIKDVVQKYAELLADELGLDSIEDVLYIRVKDIGQQINSWIENEGLYFASVEDILGHLA